MSDHELIPLTREAMQQLAGPEFDDDSRAIAEWLADGPAPAFHEIAERLLALHGRLHRRGWYEPDEFVAHAVAELEAAMTAPRGHGHLASAVARLVELTREIVHDPRPPPSGGSGPLAGQMSLGRVRR